MGGTLGSLRGNTEENLGYNGYIGQLPDPIIGHILDYLPFQDAARTCVLSREWRYKWLNLSIIDYGTGGEPKTRIDKWLSGIHSLLEQGDGAIAKLLLYGPELEISYTEIDRILKLVCKKGVRNIFFGINGEPYKLESSFFSCPLLAHLRLCSCVFRPPPDFAGFRKLVTLVFIDVIITDHVLLTLISQCPLLQTLYLKLAPSHTLNRLKFTAPNLKYFHCRSPFITVLSVAAPCLVEAGMEYQPRESSEQPEEELMSVPDFEYADSIKRLHIDYHYIKSLHNRGSLYKFKNLRSIILSNMCFGITHEVKCMLGLMNSCPILEKLMILVAGAGAGDEEAVTLIEELDHLSCCLVHQVHMADISGSRAELAFIKTLLFKLQNLEIMAIETDLDNVSDNGLNICKMVSRFPRTSPRAIVDFRASGYARKSCIDHDNSRMCDTN